MSKNHNRFGIMIDFACEKFKIEDLFRCTFQLSSTEYQILQVLIEEAAWFEVKELTCKVNKERSTIHKSVKKLVDVGLVQRRKLNRDRGGYLFVYKAIPKGKIKEKVKNIVDEWTHNAKQSIEKW